MSFRHHSKRLQNKALQKQCVQNCSRQRGVSHSNTPRSTLSCMIAVPWLLLHHVGPDGFIQSSELFICCVILPVYVESAINTDCAIGMATNHHWRVPVVGGLEKWGLLLENAYQQGAECTARSTRLWSNLTLSPKPPQQGRNLFCSDLANRRHDKGAPHLCVMTGLTVESSKSQIWNKRDKEEDNLALPVIF